VYILRQNKTAGVARLVSSDHKTFSTICVNVVKLWGFSVFSSRWRWIVTEKVAHEIWMLKERRVDVNFTDKNPVIF